MKSFHQPTSFETHKVTGSNSVSPTLLKSNNTQEFPKLSFFYSFSEKTATRIARKQLQVRIGGSKEITLDME